jgi:hypothetical protein
VPHPLNSSSGLKMLRNWFNILWHTFLYWYSTCDQSGTQTKSLSSDFEIPSVAERCLNGYELPLWNRPVLFASKRSLCLLRDSLNLGLSFFLSDIVEF